MVCKNCAKDKKCIDCFSLIDGVALQRKLASSRKIVLETSEGESFDGELFTVSPVGLGIKVQELIPSPYYLVTIHNNFRLKIRQIGSRGKEKCYGFDIMEVLRDGKSTSRLNSEEYKVLAMSAEQLVDEMTNNLPDNVKNIVQDRLKDELEKAKIFDSLKVGRTFKYQKDNLKPLSVGNKEINISEKQLGAIAEKCSKTGSPQRELFVDQDKTYDIHGIPFDYQSGGILLLDVTSVINQERELMKKEIMIYREAIEAVTGGKLLLVGREELSAYAETEPIFEMTVNVPQEINTVRSHVERLLQAIGMPEKEIFLVTVSVSEAVTNALKHAGGGSCKVWLMSDKVRIEISDCGSGISFKNLPKATLMQHFSTTKSLGCGFTIMLKFLDKIIMATDSGGTTVILEKVTCMQPLVGHCR